MQATSTSILEAFIHVRGRNQTDDPKMWLSRRGDIIKCCTLMIQQNRPNTRADELV